MKMKYLVANWKANKSVAEAEEWLRQISNYKFLISNEIPNSKFQIPNLRLILAASFIHLQTLKELIEEKQLQEKIFLAAQNVSPFPTGAYTGEVTAEMLKDLVNYVIVGHSERRKYFGETNERVAEKIKQAQAFDITPIVCVDEPYLELSSKFKVQSSKLIFAYEPISAIGTGKPETAENANRVVSLIKNKTDPNVPVLYGGSITAGNVKEFLKEENIDGFLVGGASLDAAEFLQLTASIKEEGPAAPK